LLAGYRSELATVQAYAADLRNILEESDFTDRKAFLRSFIKKIVVEREQVTVTYKLPQKQLERVQELMKFYLLILMWA